MNKLKTYAMLLSILLNTLFSSHVQASEQWLDWQRFKQVYLSDDGRVIDPANQQFITTSEGQSYGLFFALVANDPSAFQQILQWTENNLAQGSLKQHLPAWLWGKKADGQWGVLDSNSASDSDSWIAYCLLEAGRLWGIADYRLTGEALLQRIIDEETVVIPSLGRALLPGKVGFVTEDSWQLNPSYYPLQILTYFQGIQPQWREITDVSRKILLDTAPQGLAPDWANWSLIYGWQNNKTTDIDKRQGAERYRIGSYNAIRVYLWLGMLAEDYPEKQKLITHFSPMQRATLALGAPPESVNIFSREVTELQVGPVGFSAALLPFLASLSPSSYTLTLQRQRSQQFQIQPDNYYNAVLTLFGRGWDERYYRFTRRGELQPQWIK